MQNKRIHTDLAVQALNLMKKGQVAAYLKMLFDIDAMRRNMNTFQEKPMA